ncbi:hypothetical protein AOY33_14260 [Enterococcus durans]|nr:hypothetical protein AOY33_14260 [Enterococcus durans]
MKKKITVTAMSLLMALFLLPINGFAYTINNEFNLASNQGDSRLAYQNYILIHETATLAPASNVAANMWRRRDCLPSRRTRLCFLGCTECESICSCTN